jgi:hypothetical protein
MRYLLIFLLLCLPAWGATYYLNNAATGANDGSSEANGWHSWADMMTTINAFGDNGSGDTVIVSAGSGTYGDCTDSTADERTDWLTIIAKSGETPVLDTFAINTGSGSKTKYLRLDGLTIYDAVQPISNAIQLAFCNTVYLHDCIIETVGLEVDESLDFSFNNAIGFAAVSEITIDGCVIRKRSGSANLFGFCTGILSNISGNSGIIIQDCEIKDCAFGIYFAKPASDVLVDNCTVHDIGSDAIMFDGLTNSTISDNRVYDLMNSRRVLDTSGASYDNTTKTVTADAGTPYYFSKSIDGVNTATKTFTHNGENITACFPYKGTLVITGSTGNNGSYTISSSNYTAGNTNVIVTTTPPSDVADGSMFYRKYTAGCYARITVGGATSGWQIIAAGPTGSAFSLTTGFGAGYTSSSVTQVEIVAGYHTDFIQLFGAEAATDNITITRNKLYNNLGCSAQGIRVGADTYQCGAITISSNLIYNVPTTNELSLDDISNLVLVNNTIIGSVDIGVTGAAFVTNVTMYDNLVTESIGSSATDISNGYVHYPYHSNNTAVTWLSMDTALDATDVDTTTAIAQAYFTNYAGNDFTLISGAAATRTGTVLGATVDVEGNAFYDPPDRGCYRFNKGKLLMMRK